LIPKLATISTQAMICLAINQQSAEFFVELTGEYQSTDAQPEQEYGIVGEEVNLVNDMF
jgi:hypothetical protein